MWEVVTVVFDFLLLFFVWLVVYCFHPHVSI